MDLATYIRIKVGEDWKFWPPIVLKDDKVILIDGIASMEGERPILFVLAPYKLITDFDSIQRLANKHGGIDEVKTYPGISYMLTTFTIIGDYFKDDRWGVWREIVNYY